MRNLYALDIPLNPVRLGSSSLILLLDPLILKLTKPLINMPL